MLGVKEGMMMRNKRFLLSCFFFGAFEPPAVANQPLLPDVEFEDSSPVGFSCPPLSEDPEQEKVPEREKKEGGWNLSIRIPPYVLPTPEELRNMPQSGGNGNG